MDEDERVAYFLNLGESKNTKKGEMWAINNYNEWANRNSNERKNFDQLMETNKEEISASLQRWYIGAVGKRKRELDVDSQRVLFHNLIRAVKKKTGIDIKNETAFTALRTVGNGVVKEQRLKQRKVEAKQAEELTFEEELMLYESDILNPITPLQLNYSLFFHLSIGWGVRGGVLAYVDPTHIKKEEHKGLKFLVYNTAVDKNHQGKLNQSRIPPNLKIMENPEDSKKCPIALFDKIMKLRPADSPYRLFLKPLQYRQKDCWYCKQPVGANTIAKYTENICSAAGIKRRTNQFGRRTMVTRMYKAGFSMEEIMIFTGHQSLENLKTYITMPDDTLIAKASAVQGVNTQKIIRKSTVTTKKDGEETTSSQESKEEICVTTTEGKEAKLTIKHNKNCTFNIIIK